jgi:ABC-2 type transport system ATP-binding protein
MKNTATHIIEVKQLTKTYKGLEEPVLKQIDLNVKSGEIFGILGPNGAGKTTLINILCGLKDYESGSVFIDAHDIQKEPGVLKRLIGVVPQEIALYDKLSARENLHFFGSCYGLKGSELKEKTEMYLERFGLVKSASRQVKTFSGGMKRRVNLIAAIMHNPRVLFLDEPTVGIDVQSRTVIVDFLREFNQSGSTIFYTSHHMKEAENLCTCVAIMDNGKIVASGTPSQLKEEYQVNYLEDVFLNVTGKDLRD